MILLWVVMCYGQKDSLPIDLAQLGWQDLRSGSTLELDRKVSSASRSLQDINELPFSIIVIGEEEIRRNGYITLADAVKMLPGLRVSQPGSAMEGELFMMRGLSGNAYTKILIDGAPVKPYMVNGMPIGAQLPIQLAERIEVIYGPAAALYGADATAGIINIVTKSSERPIYADASLHTGSQDYFTLNALFGGKLGQGDDVLHFKLFGSNTRFSDWRTIYDQEELYNPTLYARILPNRAEELLESPNYRGTATKPVINELPHLSRSFGVDLNYRFLEASYINLQRQDHSALGLNPLSISYANPLNFTGETIEEGHLKAKAQLKSISLQTTAGFLRYELDVRSSNTYIIPALEGILDVFAEESPDPEKNVDLIHENFFDRSRFMRNKSNEFYLEQTADFSLLPRDQWTVGLKFQIADGEPFLDFQPNPIRSEGFEPDNLENSFSDPSYQEFSFFAQWFVPLEKWTFLLGAQYFHRSTSDFTNQITSFNPRLAILYKSSDKLSFRASYSTAFKIPSPFLSASSYTIRENNFESILTGIVPLDSEKTFSIETGLRWNPSSKVEWDVSAFFTHTNDFVTYDLVSNPRVSIRNLTIGYFNNDDTEAKLFGLQSFLKVSDLWSAIKLDAQLAFQLSSGEETFFPFDPQSGPLEEHISGIQALRAYPGLMTQLRLQLEPIDGLGLSLDHILMSAAMPRNILEIEQRLSAGATEQSLRHDGFFTLDVSLNLRLSSNLEMYAKVFNVLDAKYAGIDANDGPDVLFYNPQSLRRFRLGVNYFLR